MGDDMDIGGAPSAAVQDFLKETSLYLAPDPEIMNNHGLEPRTAFEDQCIGKEGDPVRLEIVRERILAGVNESYEMLENMGAAPGAKWGDCVSAVYTASGDLSLASSGGVVIFCNLVQYPIKFVNKYWSGDPTVGIKEGDVFIVNDARYGQAHNTDQSMMMPVFHEGRIVAWAGATVHEGENGAIEPGGMPSLAEQIWDEGLKMSPFKVAENYRLRRDLVTFLQNSVREPKLQYADMKVKMYVCRRIETRIHEAIAEYGVEAVVAALRMNLEDTDAEVRRRLLEWPDGTTRHAWWTDGTLRENVQIKINLALTKKGDEITFDYRGSSPEFTNRSNNSLDITVKGMLAQLFLTFIWPDIPRNQGVLAPVKFIFDNPSVLKPAFGTPNAQSMMTVFTAWSAGQVCAMKFLYSNPKKYTRVLAPWFNMINTFLFGGLTQHGEMVGNVCADINGMGGGALADRDGEHGCAPIFATMSDIGEQEFIEEEMPFIQIVSKKMMKDNQGFGRQRGGMGYQMVLAMRDSPAFGFMLTAMGAKFPNIPGLFGGYGCPTYPLSRVSGVDVFEILKTDPGSFRYSIEELMNERPFKDAKYTTHPMTLGYTLAQRGELYMISQGTGGGFGDPLDRKPEDVIRDLDEDLISHDVAWRVYRVVYDNETLHVDEEATEEAREAMRKERIAKSKPFDAFCEGWVKDKPSGKVPYYGCWDDKTMVHAGSPDTLHPAAQVNPPVIMANPLQVKIDRLEAELAACRKGQG
ncbi:hydantoinase B/oxoprolinase family protein [Parvibaculum sp.]|jgi:N-methylhydantoinase B/oxoprolinase/acetone carboxylase alpha subunit|uniref:hydantoinase B/oxoprolinase family protein n=1 Tax=Parvibaculum sp. TaxID=2024848 RepID=UPI001B061D7D|nr:hydantoinase B/oxoprolinase family protein [Parvibaculum sp.]MBO6633183.1 hydantoinase B/oxoprolinase family protein [Parvibaculum sp.]MBO6678849.1 hydantoinase B/oxoprolinase family protein [Parvibaculum sp.]MBO6683742.1 hydantoinase B/oxoprolinase family protein [Parvibaculum sp.]MBO6906246.1 hydantoinase B/oxoprolinase family protein [Parvibaculum sp.]